MIRKLEPKDVETLKAIHAANQLPEQCLPNFNDPLILHTGVVVQDKKIVMSCSLRGAAELYLLVDHTAGTPEDRWNWMRELKEHIMREAYFLGLDQLSCWIPPELEESFQKRLEEMGFQRSPWSCYTLNIES